MVENEDVNDYMGLVSEVVNSEIVKLRLTNEPGVSLVFNGSGTHLILCIEELENDSVSVIRKALFSRFSDIKEMKDDGSSQHNKKSLRVAIGLNCLTTSQKSNQVSSRSIRCAKNILLFILLFFFILMSITMFDIALLPHFK